MWTAHDGPCGADRMGGPLPGSRRVAFRLSSRARLELAPGLSAEPADPGLNAEPASSRQSASTSHRHRTLASPRWRGRRRHPVAMRTLESHHVIGAALHGPSQFVHRSMVPSAQSDEVREIGLPATHPVDHVMNFREVDKGTAREATAFVPARDLNPLGHGGAAACARFWSRMEPSPCSTENTTLASQARRRATSL